MPPTTKLARIQAPAAGINADVASDYVGTNQASSLVVPPRIKTESSKDQRVRSLEVRLDAGEVAVRPTAHRDLALRARQQIAWRSELTTPFPSKTDVTATLTQDPARLPLRAVRRLRLRRDLRRFDKSAARPLGRWRYGDRHTDQRAASVQGPTGPRQAPVRARRHCSRHVHASRQRRSNAVLLRRQSSGESRANRILARRRLRTHEPHRLRRFRTNLYPIVWQDNVLYITPNITLPLPPGGWES